MKIGTWNLAGRWDSEHLEFMQGADCDVWLLTEVNERVELDGFERHLSAGLMAARRRWAGIFSRQPLDGLPDPHLASAAATVDGITYCASILPWRSCGGAPTWLGHNHAEKTEIAVAQLVRALPTRALVWGGDWNHALSGTEFAGSEGGREHVLNAVTKLALQVPTRDLPHRLDGCLSIDHIAVPAESVVTRAMRLVAKGLSDHDCYTVDVALDG